MSLTGFRIQVSVTCLPFGGVVAIVIDADFECLPDGANDDGIGILATDKACVLHIVYQAKLSSTRASTSPQMSWLPIARFAEPEPQSMGASVTTRMATRQIASPKDEAGHVDDEEQKGEEAGKDEVDDDVADEVGGTPAR
ncbi:hypothetical protein BJ912DRAFT_933887 [Pholiota molesta]|nr:hypothetical protein BJ912DRAFT_933887 [Pholiota molesta]